MSTIGLYLVATTWGAAPDGDAPPVEQIRETIRRSVPYVEEQGAWWINEKKCVSCHRVGTMVWSLTAARQRGIPVSNRLDEWFDWAIDRSLTTNDKGNFVGSGNKEGVAQLLLAGNPENRDPDRRESFRRLADIIADDLEIDGTWKPGGQLPFQKRPKPETTDVTTMWLALALADQDSGGERRAEVAKAVEHVTAGSPGKSTEWYAVRLLLARKLGDRKTATAMIEKLRNLQQTDGGWGWIAAEKSDALGTGMALYALLQAGLDRGERSVTRAQQFLIGTQREDGSWAVPGTKANKRNKIEETAVYWGTTWAVLALAESLPD